MLKVYARGAAMVPVMHIDARRFVAREPVAVDGRTGWAPTNEPAEVPAIAEYIQALKDGDLWPADEATAQAAGPTVKFDPTCGGTRVDGTAKASPSAKKGD